jgi:hypothetical protein
MYNTVPKVRKNAPKDATNGQGLGSTKCQLCFVFKYPSIFFIKGIGFNLNDSKLFNNLALARKIFLSTLIIMLRSFKKNK